MCTHPGQPDTSPSYLSYLVRLWRTQSDGRRVWRASLEEPLTQEVRRFNSLSDLFAFLLEQSGQDSGGAEWHGDHLSASTP